MGGKSKSITSGFWYKIAYHHGLTIGPIDALLEYRGGDKTAWQGELTSSGTIHINAPQLWGGEKDQGGIVGDLDVMFGEPTQLPNPYLVSTFGAQTTAWRGFATVAFHGKYGANNPYPQKASYKFRQILQGWDDTCWYPEKAQVAVLPPTAFTDDLAFPATLATVDGSYAGIRITGVSERDTIIIAKPAGLTYKAWSPWNSDSEPLAHGTPWTNTFKVTDASGNVSEYWSGLFATAAEAEAAFANQFVQLTGSTSYTVWLYDTPVTDNRGGLSLRIYKGGTLAINPAHVLYYSRTNSDMGREPAANINEPSLRAAADKLYAEGFGICPKWDPASESVEDFEQRICKLIGGSFTRSLEDGQWYLDLARGDYVLEDLPVLTDDDILEFKEQPSVLDNAINSVSVRYFDPEKKETIVTPPVRALGLVASFGTIHQTYDYPEIPTAELANRIALRELLATSTPTRAFDTATTRKPHGWRPNKYFRLQSTKRGIADMVCIVGEPQSGTLKSGAIKMKMAQDIYGLPAASFVAVEPGVDTRPSGTPVPITVRAAMEAPYVVVAGQMDAKALADLEADAAFVLAFAANPGRQRDFTMQVSPHGAATYTTAGDGEWCGAANIVEGDTLLDAAPATSFTFTTGIGLNQVQAGSTALWDTEIVRVDAIDAAVGTLVLGRACGDTVAVPHDAGARIYFFGIAAAFDTTQFTAGESLDVRLLANTGSAQQDSSGAAVMTVLLVGRLALPYPPGKLRIAGSPYPSSVSGAFTVTWAHRNRVAQADQLVDDSMASVTPADNTRYRLKFVDGSGATLVERADIGPATATVVLDYTGTVTMTLETISDAGVSLQHHAVTFAYTPPSPAPGASTITATAYTPVDTSTIIDGGTI